MFENYREFFNGLAPLKIDESASERDIQVSICVLLAGLAHTDKNFAANELNSMIVQLFSEFGLSETDSAELVELSQFLLKDGSRINQYVEKLRAGLNEDQRQIIMAMVWRLAIADGKIDQVESAYAAKLRADLGLSMEQAVRARKMAELNNLDFELQRLIK
ncbi:MAG: TerB family tellurite resistance protein [Oligoflexia bacterium]|nr:TerB family tellurite resistance protein [Oligoflexia bacterium]